MALAAALRRGRRRGSPARQGSRARQAASLHRHRGRDAGSDLLHWTGRAHGWEAVALLESSGRPQMQVAAELGIQPSMLRQWRATLNGASPRPRPSGSTGISPPSPVACPPVDPLQQHRELGRCERHRGPRHPRPDEAALLQPLREEAQPLTVPPQDLDQPPRTAAEHEDLSGERIAVQVVLHQRGKPVEALPHVRVTGGQPHAQAQGNGDHRSSSAARRSRTRAGSAPASARSL